ncbi:MAG: ACP S-malonyltransferase, partial [Verrucomicrobiota bacterium]
DIDVANFNAPGQIVISGAEEGIDQAIAGAKEKGIRIAKKLEVAGAYHSRLMKSAQDQLVPVLGEASMSSPPIPVYCNVDARPVTDDADIRETLARQVSGSVRWSESIQKLIAKGHSTFLELGPGGILAGLMKRIDKSVNVIRIEDLDSIEAAVTALS